MSELSEQQRRVIELDGDVFVTACPGSGKTRVLTEKIIRTLDLGISRTQRVAAVTYTRHAADEIGTRLLEKGYSRKQLWTGTIHSFALDWVLRPYAVYDAALSRGFAVADEHYLKRLVDSLRMQFGVNARQQINTKFDRNGELVADDESVRLLVIECRRQLKAMRLLDFDLVLYTAYSLLQRVPEIAKTLGTLFKLICIDEYQDTHDLQYGILASVVRASSGGMRMFIVGDKNQAIYSSLGGVAKTVQEVKDEFNRPSLFHRELSGNYRSTQRIVDFCGNLCESGEESITSLSSRASESGLLTFSNQTVGSHQLASRISRLVKYHLSRGVKPHEICILGPNWDFLKDVGTQLILTLPDVDIDAPGISLLRYQPESVWFQLARLFLTDPSPIRYRARLKWAADFVAIIEDCLGIELPEGVRSARSILRLVNAISSEEESGLSYLDLKPACPGVRFWVGA